MENCSNKYLHKKFKKQVNSEPAKSQQQSPEEKENGSSSPGGNKRDAAAEEPKERVSPNLENRFKDHNDGVPKPSTNELQKCLNSSDYPSASDKSSISVDSVGVKEKESCEQLSGVTSERDAVPPVNDCISRATRPSREPDSNYKSVNFDTSPSFSRALVESSSASSPYDRFPSFYEKSEYHISSQAVSRNDQNPPSEEQSSDNKDSSVETTPVEKSSGGKYVCSYCNLACSKPSVLQKHIRAHTNERPYPCISCGFSFKTRSNLYKHCRSRTHANRVMGNKTQEISGELDESQNKSETDQSYENVSELSKENAEMMEEEGQNNENRMLQDMKSRPYKPRFHKLFYQNASEEAQKRKPENNPNKHPANSDLLSLHINEVINKNNAIVNSNESLLLKRRSVDNGADPKNNDSGYHPRTSYFPVNMIPEERNHDEPLNLSSKNRKRCMSEVGETTTHKSLIKELLLKNLHADTNMQCPYCKMIFQTFTELELHKLRSCKGFTKSDVEYNRSNSVNVASILTQNKNAFDSLSQFSSPFALKSPGPFLGKTRLVESDKGKSFSFDDNLPSDIQFSSFMSPSDILKTSQRYSISPLTIRFDREKKAPIKMFGGEVKITHTSGETKSFKIDNQDTDGFGNSTNFTDYGGKLRENRVVKSSLQSGGTVLQGKPNYGKHDPSRSSPEVIRVYETTALSPSIDMSSLEKTKFGFDRGHLQERSGNDQVKLNSRDAGPRSSVVDLGNVGHSHKYTNIVDFSQKAAKMLVPNLKQPNLTIPGVPVPNRIPLPASTIETKLLHSDFFEPIRLPVENERVSAFTAPFSKVGSSEKEQRVFSQKPLEQQSLSHEGLPSSQAHPGQNFYNPVNLLVNGKVIRYVPGIPGPVVAEPPVNIPSRSIISQPSPRPVPVGVLRSPKSKQETVPYSATKMPVMERPPSSPVVLNSPAKSQDFLQIEKRTLDPNERLPRSPKMEKLEIKVTEAKLSEQRSLITRTPEGRSPNTLATVPTETQRKFSRPNTLALKPSISALKQHHGLTPTMFNQILISPDTPRVAKKYIQHFLNGNYFSYLGLKSSTRPTYCTLNKTQPFYVPHFKKLSMYSEWRQQESKTDEMYVSGYDSRQKQQKYTTSGRTSANLVVHSSYKSEAVKKETDDQPKSNSLTGGYESNEEYTYIRGRGRGRYVCDQCGIRCKKPSMLKKHIRTHTNDRPFTCSHCNFSFKTKGNLTKHMKSKSHTKNYAASSSSSSSTHQSSTQSSDSDTEDSGMDSSDESTRQQEHEAAYGLLSLSQKPHNLPPSSSSIDGLSPKMNETMLPLTLEKSSFMNTEQVTHVNNTNYAKNKILDHQAVSNFSSLRVSTSAMPTTAVEQSSKETENLTQFLGKTNTQRPLTYPYLSAIPGESPTKQKIIHGTSENQPKPAIAKQMDMENLLNFKNLMPESHEKLLVAPKPQKIVSPKAFELKKVAITISYDPKYVGDMKSPVDVTYSTKQGNETVAPVIKVNNEVVTNEINTNDPRKRKLSIVEQEYKLKTPRTDSDVMDLSFSSNLDRSMASMPSKHIIHSENGNIAHSSLSPDSRPPMSFSPQIINLSKNSPYILPERSNISVADKGKLPFKAGALEAHESETFYGDKSNESESQMRLSKENVGYSLQENHVVQYSTESSESFNSVEYDNSAMQTLADVATKQVKLEKNSLAKNVASEFLKLATKNEFQGNEKNNFGPSNKDVNELITKSEENKSCTICLKNFSKPSQLRLHMNIHYLERPFRCDSCSVSFRTRGHLQKHERSASHHNKLSSSPMLSSSEPRPFKCSDCSIAFRIHGHLAKHLRSKMHIMKLECLAKIPFGLYAELERANSLLTEINTTDGDQCLESLRALAKKVFINDPKKLNHFQGSNPSTDS